MNSRPLLLVLFSAGLVQAQPFLNLDFEVATRNRPRSWPAFSTAFEYSSDTAQKVTGNRSMRIRSLTASDTALGFTQLALPLDQVHGRQIRVTGYIKGETTAPGYPAIYLRVDGQAGGLSFDTSPQPGATGSSDWRRFQFDRLVNPQAVQVVVGVFLLGRGSAWFDSIQVEVEGVPLRQGPEPLIGEPSRDQLDWLRTNAIPLRTPDAGSGFDDLQPLKQIIGNARVVGLGEATHGTREFFRMKHRMVEFLATEMGFTIFSIEANMPEAYRVNDYVLRGRGDPKRLLAGMYFWTWNTQEVLDMIEWMREFNASGRGRIQFTGNDMQTAPVAATIVREFVAKAEPSYLATVNAAYQRVQSAAPLATNTQALLDIHWDASWAAHGVREYFEANFDKYVAASTLAEADWALQNARIVEMAAYVKIGGGLHRDEMMAHNTRWILDRNPGAKMALWAHNYHVSRLPGAQGSWLSRFYGADYRNLGFAFHEGKYNAVSLATGRLGPADAAPSFPGSVEYVFHQTGLLLFVLDLRKASATNAGSWLLSEQEFREIGAVVTDGFSARGTLTQDYDALIYFDQTTPSVLLPF